MAMKLTNAQKTMLGLFLAVVALVLLLWVLGVFGGSGFGRVNRARSRFGRITNSSRFGALGVPDNFGPVKFVINYTNPSSFGTLDGNQSIWNGLVFSLSTTDNPIATSGPNTNTVGSILTELNPFYVNKYKPALIEYYGSSYSPTGIYTPVTDYTNFTNLSYNSKEKIRKIIPVALSQNFTSNTTLSNELTNIIGADIPPNEIGTVIKEITRLLKFATAFRNSTDFSNVYGTPNPTSIQSTNGAYQGVYLDASSPSTVKSAGLGVNLMTVKQPGWLDFNPTTFKFGVGIINSNLTYKTSESKIFPFMISDIDETTVTLGGSSTSGNPSGLTVTATYW